MGFWKSLFTGSDEKQEDNQRKEEKNFDILKFDGVRAQRMGRLDYALRCFDEALSLKEDFETLSFKSATLISLNRLDEAREVLERMAELESQSVDVRIALANVLYMSEDYEAMKEAAAEAVGPAGPPDYSWGTAPRFPWAAARAGRSGGCVEAHTPDSPFAAHSRCKRAAAAADKPAAQARSAPSEPAAGSP